MYQQLFWLAKSLNRQTESKPEEKEKRRNQERPLVLFYRNNIQLLGFNSVREDLQKLEINLDEFSVGGGPGNIGDILHPTARYNHIVSVLREKVPYLSVAGFRESLFGRRNFDILICQLAHDQECIKRLDYYLHRRNEAVQEQNHTYRATSQIVFPDD
jgi:hypothetical protein